MPRKPELHPAAPLYVVPNVQQRAVIVRALHEASEHQSDPKVVREMREVGARVFDVEWSAMIQTVTVKRAIERGWTVPATGDPVASAVEFMRDKPVYDPGDSDLPF